MLYFAVSDSQQHLNVLRGLALQLQHIVYQENQKCWGKPLGSSNLWQEHVETIKRIQLLANQIEIREVSINGIAFYYLIYCYCYYLQPGPEIRPKLHDLPEECIREIILRIADHRDLEVKKS